jgi:N-acetylglucosaminyldiphosphoundecaprenol N-acetyl-beta-D-mannosaminyltransferase
MSNVLSLDAPGTERRAPPLLRPPSALSKPTEGVPLSIISDMAHTAIDAGRTSIDSSHASFGASEVPGLAAQAVSNRPACILNARFDRLSSDEVVEELTRTIRAGQRGVLCTVNVAILMMMRSDARLQRFVDSAKWTVADGQPIIWASHLTRKPLPERVAGVDLIDQLCARAARENIGVYFLGATDKIVLVTVDALRNRHPRLDVRGYANGYFASGEASARAQAVAQSGAELLFVAMGVPLQECFIEEQWERLGARVVIGVGGSFDVIAGLRRRAPVFFQRAGLEWAWRLVQEPRRLFIRYLTTNSRFVGLMFWTVVVAALRSSRAIPRVERELQ